MPSNSQKTTFILNVIFLFLIAMLVFLFTKFLLPPLLPFIAAFIIVTLSKSLIKRLSSIGISRRWAVILIYSVSISILTLSVFWIFRSLALEAISLYKQLTNDNSGVFQTDFFDKFQKFLNKIPFLRESSGFDSINRLLTSAITSIIPKLISYLMSFLKFFPSAVIFITITAISLFYIGIDYEKIVSFISLQFSENTKQRYNEIKNVFSDTAKNLFRAYFLLTLITFIQLLCGFLILRVKYAFILATIISLIDLFPILGTGTVLLPWAFYCLIDGSMTRAAGLCVLYIIILFFRQISEPRIIGAQTGLSPLLSLIAMFCGLKIAGIYGLFLFPIVIITVKSLNESGSIHLYKNPSDTKLGKAENLKRKFISSLQSKKK